MERRKFGNTDLEVSAISLGCWIFGVDWWGHYTDERAIELCQFCYDQGDHLLRQRRRLRQRPGRNALRQVAQRRRHRPRQDRDRRQVRLRLLLRPRRARLAPRAQAGLLPARSCRIALEQSLKRLGTDYIDLYMAHNIKLPQFRDDLFAELEKIKDEGKIKVWGVSASARRSAGARRASRRCSTTAPRPCRPSSTCSSRTPAASSARRPVATKAGVLARVHDNSSILKDVVKIDTDHRRERPPQVPRPVLENLRPEEAGTGPPLRHRPRHERPPARLQVAAPAAGPDAASPARF